LKSTKFFGQSEFFESPTFFGQQPEFLGASKKKVLRSEQPTTPKQKSSTPPSLQIFFSMHQLCHHIKSPEQIHLHHH
jgi:hypothetical protein